MMQRQRFPISTSGGVTKGDTGRLAGIVQQMSWAPTTADTGQPATVQLAILPDDADTGKGWLFYSAAAHQMGAVFVRSPRQPQHGSDGAADQSDTGAAFGVPVVGANDRMRVKVVPGDTGVVIAGALYVWTQN